VVEMRLADLSIVGRASNQESGDGLRSKDRSSSSEKQTDAYESYRDAKRMIVHAKMF